jgi:2-keto-3-deoxy-L-rhamnonate aldolase RhmA
VKALERLQRDEPVFGMMQTYPDPALTELAIWCGYDFIMLDAEHGVQDETAQLNVLRTIAASHAFSLVRTRSCDKSEVARYLDFGADGVIVPNVSTALQVKRIVACTRDRWTGGLRADRYGLKRERADLALPLFLVLIESPQGVENVEAILGIEGVNGALVGPGDLSVRLGRPGEFAAPEFLTAVEQVERAVRLRNKILGGKIDETTPLLTLLERGHRLIIVGRDMALVRNGFLEALDAVKREPFPTQRQES